MDSTHKPLCAKHRVSKNTILDTEPWDEYHLPVPHPKNGARMIGKLRTKLRHVPTKRDIPGTIYGFQLEWERKQGLPYIKIGMTAAKPEFVQERLKEWSKKCGNNNPKLHLVFAIYVKKSAVKWVERVVHCYLWYVRMYRYLKKDNTFHSVSARLQKIIPDGYQCTTSGDAAELTSIRDKQTEWFFLHKDTIEAVHIKTLVQQIVANAEVRF